MSPRQVYEAAPEHYETRDLALATYLVTRGVPLVSTRVQGRTVFLALARSEAEQHLPGWWSGGDQVSARAYADTWFRLRRLVGEIVGGQ